MQQVSNNSFSSPKPGRSKALPAASLLFGLALPAIITVTQPAWSQMANCGGEGQPACTVADHEFYSNNDYRACQVDLQADGNFIKSLAGEDNCVNNRRRTLPRDQSWLGWVLHEQRYGIGQNEQINWVTTIGTHNSYSNEAQGYAAALGQNQKLSITDQLQAGARILELDPHWYLGQLALCHGDTNDACYTTAGFYSRWVSSGLTEISDWLAANPDEILEVYLDAGGSDNYISKHEDDLKSLLDLIFGPKIWTVDDTLLITKGHVPTIAQMRSRQKQIIFFTETDLQLPEVHRWTASPSLGEFGSNSTSDVDPNLKIGNCIDGDQKSALSRDRDAFFRIGEGRTLSDLIGSFSETINTSDITVTYTPAPLVNEPQVAAAVNCTASSVELDFLLSRDKVPTPEFRQSGPDNRLTAAAWSFAPNDFGNNGPAMLTGGQWVSTPVTVPGNVNKPVLHYAACSTQNPSANYADRRTWSFTRFEVPFEYANAECSCEAAATPGSLTRACYPNYNTSGTESTIFDHPLNGYENQRLIEQAHLSSVDAAWLNYKSGSQTLPSLGTAAVVFRFTRERFPSLRPYRFLEFQERS